jgi:site-specific DNA-methyltransferase (adenine-specific)
MVMRVEQIGSATLYLGDCMKLMATMPDKSIDLAICDPPFFPLSKLDYSHNRSKSTTGVKFNTYKPLKQWKIPDNNYYNEICRISKEQIIFGINYLKFENAPVGRIVWDKKRYEETMFSDGEIASCSLINSIKFFRYRWSGMLQENMKNKEIKIHPTQKPVALYEWLLLTYAKSGWKIFDSHLGSGSIAVACNKLGFNLTAIEIDEVYFNAARKRIKESIKNYEKT